jgi:hemolysin III
MLEQPPVFRGVSHALALIASVPLGLLIVIGAPGVVPRLAVAIFALSVTTMFAASALYHRVDWSTRVDRVMRRVDHSGVYLLVAGSYTAYAVLALSGWWQNSILIVVWAGTLSAIAVKFAWREAPRIVTVAIALSLGWVGIVSLPYALGQISSAAIGLALAGGLLYSIGGAIYAMRRPNPFPRFFGFHEIFHVLVIGAVACHYTAIALFGVFQT